MARGLTHIGRGTASTLKKVNNTRSQVLGNFILKREKRSDSSGGAENKSSLEMRESGITKAINLGADLERMYSCEWKAEIDLPEPSGLRSAPPDESLLFSLLRIKFPST